MTHAVMQQERGVVYAEFLMSIFVFFMLFVCIVQFSVITVARLVVQHAAVQAVRAAVVTIDDDPYFYEDGTRKHLERDGQGTGGGFVSRALSLVTGQHASAFSGLGATGTERLNRVRNAAYLPLSTISPTHRQVARYVPGADLIFTDLEHRSVADEIGDSPFLRLSTGYGVYGRVAAAVTFPLSPGSKEFHDPADAYFGDDDVVTVRVTYLLPCNVPIARKVVCSTLISMTGIPDAVGDVLKALDSPSIENLVAAQKTLSADFADAWDAFQANIGELSAAEWSVLQLPLFAMLDEYFIVLRAEATLPNHGAAYKYHSELAQEDEGSL